MINYGVKWPLLSFILPLISNETCYKQSICVKSAAEKKVKQAVDTVLKAIAPENSLWLLRSSRGQTHKAHNTQNECQILELNLLFQSFFVRRREIIMNSLQ